MRRQQQLIFIWHVYSTRVFSFIIELVSFCSVSNRQKCQRQPQTAAHTLTSVSFVATPEGHKNLFRAETLGPQPCSTTTPDSLLQKALLSHQLTGAAKLGVWSPNCPACTNVWPGSSLASLILTFMIPSCFICKTEGSADGRGFTNTTQVGS